MVKTQLQKMNDFISKQLIDIDNQIAQTWIDQKNHDLSMIEWNNIENIRNQLMIDRDVISDMESIGMRHMIHASTDKKYEIKWQNFQ